MENKLKKALGLRKKDIRKMKKLGRFTLLELLIVVAILAIIGGGMIAAYDGLEEDAAQGAATRDIAALDQAFRTYKVVERSLPNNLETLLAATPTAFNYVSAELDTAATAMTGVVNAAFIPSKLQGKYDIRTLTDQQLANLADAGITKFRYLDAAGNDTVDSDLTIVAADGTAATAVGSIEEIDIPAHAYEAPRPGNGRDRGRGFYADYSGLVDAAEAAEAGQANPSDPDTTDIDGDGDVAETQGEAAYDAVFSAGNLQLAVWDDQDPAAPVEKYNNVKIGAEPAAVLVLLGIGNASTLVGANSEVGLAHAPYYANVAKNEYNHYIAAIDVNQSPAKLVAILDTRGDFLDEEYAESIDQKQ